MGNLELPRTGNEKALKLSSEQSGWLWKEPVVWWAITCLAGFYIAQITAADLSTEKYKY